MAAGGDNGQVYFFDWDGVLKRKVASHDGAVCGIRSMEGESWQYLTGGSDGKLKMWSSKFEAEGEVELCTHETVLGCAVLGQDVKGVQGGVKSLDCWGAGMLSSLAAVLLDCLFA